MANISPTYASPGLRLGLLLEDHPHAAISYDIVPGAELNIPKSQGGDEDFVVATIKVPGASPVYGFKALSARPANVRFDHPSDQFNLNCTKALGRALKRAGYPDDMEDLKSLVVWRKRNAELEALLGGHASLQLTQSDPALALGAAAKDDPEATSPDDGDVDVVEVEAPPTERPVSDETRAKLRNAINGLGPRSGELTAWCKTRGLKVTKPANEVEANMMIDQAIKMMTGDDDPGIELSDGEDPATDASIQSGSPGEEAVFIAEQIESLDEGERAAFTAFAKSIEMDPNSDPATWSAAVTAEVLAWLSVG